MEDAFDQTCNTDIEESVARWRTRLVVADREYIRSVFGFLVSVLHAHVQFRSSESRQSAFTYKPSLKAHADGVCQISACMIYEDEYWECFGSHESRNEPA